MTNTDRVAQALRDNLPAIGHVINPSNCAACNAVANLRAALAEHDALASLAPPAVEGEPVAWLHQDGDRVITAQTKAAALRDGGASASSVALYAEPLYTAAQVAALTAQCEGMTKKNRILEIKNAGTLANNLCPDHRDKQIGKPCLACTIETLQRKLDSAIAAGNGEGV